MARARSPSSIEAERLYQDGMKLVDIAKKIGVPDSTVRRWNLPKNGMGIKANRVKKKKPNARIKRKRTLGNQKERREGIRMLPATPHLPLKEIKMQKHMDPIPRYTGIPWTMKNWA